MTDDGGRLHERAGCDDGLRGEGGVLVGDDVAFEPSAGSVDARVNESGERKSVPFEPRTKPPSLEG